MIFRGSLKHNLHGLEICPRAAQLAELALVFKAREQSRRFFQPEQLVRPQIIELQDVQFKDGELNDYIEALDLGELFDPNLVKLLRQFEEAKTFGSLIQPCLDERAIAFVRRTIEAKDLGGQLFLRETHLKVLRLLEQAESLTQRYHVVVANPPYMGGKQMNPQVKDFAKESFPSGKSDLFAMFIERGLDLVVESGYSAMVTMEAWMFLSSYAELRSWLITSSQVECMIHMPYVGKGGTSMGINFGTTATIWLKRPDTEARAHYQCIRYYECDDGGVPLSFPTANERQKWASGDDFKMIPGNPIAYWLSDQMRQSFRDGLPLGEVAEPRVGLQTGENARFVRRWHEVALVNCEFGIHSRDAAAQSGKHWFPYNKGGEFQRWYGNQEFVVDWANDGANVKAFTDENGRLRSRPQNLDFYFRPSVSWSKIGSGWPSFRYYPKGFIFDVAGTSIFSSLQDDLMEILGLTNSLVVRQVLELFSPTLNFEVGHISSIPYLRSGGGSCLTVVEQLVDLARADWDNFETSWDFADLPLLRLDVKRQALESSWRIWEAQCSNAIHRMQELETENNRLFISAYGLDSELQPEVPEEQITLALAEPRKDLAAFLSYATGCMMGRYSLDQPGLILADSRYSQTEQLAAYEDKVGKPLSEVQFKPDPDGIIPVLDGEWFEDDIVARTRDFLSVTFPESSVGENLRFIEESLGKDIRKYFCSEFYKDHLQTYKKRPIYWMVHSPKKGFACLIYLHRYTKDTLNQVLNNYFRPYLQKLEARLAQLGLDQLNDDLPARERTAARKEAEKITKVLKECQAWEQDALLPLAQQRIELDLDDGVKVNYLKLQDVLAPIPGLAAKED